MRARITGDVAVSTPEQAYPRIVREALQRGDAQRAASQVRSSLLEDPNRRAPACTPAGRTRPEHPAPPDQGVVLSRDEFERLQRLLHLLVTTVGELQLWNANAGRSVTEIQS